MDSSRVAGLIVTAAVFFANMSTEALAAEIPAKYRGVWAVDQESCKLPRSESDVGELPWVIVGRQDYEFHEGACSLISVRSGVKRNADELTFSCVSEGEKARDKQHWSLESTRIKIRGLKMSQARLKIANATYISIPEGMVRCGLEGHR